MATTASNGPAACSRQASARESRWNWSHETGKIFSGLSGLAGGFGINQRAAAASCAFTVLSIASTAPLAACNFCGSRERTTILVLGPSVSSKNG